MEDDKELRDSIQRFYLLLKNYPDEPGVVFEFTSFLRYFLRIRSNQPLPTIEVMTLIKHQKPVVFSQLRKMAPNNMMLNILTELSMDKETANDNLKNIIE